MKSHFTQLGFVLCAVACGASSLAHASEGAASPPAPELSIAPEPGAAPLRVQLVGDDALATQTGKYAGASRRQTAARCFSTRSAICRS